MKTHAKALLRIMTLLALLSVEQMASAYYDPGVQRWIHRDPVSDKGFRVLVAAKATVEQPNAFRFVRNEPVHGLDALGLLSVPPGSSEGAGGRSWESVGHCIAIGLNRQKEYEELGRHGRLVPNADKWYHCVSSCEMTRTCGVAVAWALGKLREIWQDFAQPGHDPTGTDTALDKRASRDGRGCGDCKEKRSCEECCGALGYRRF